MQAARIGRRGRVDNFPSGGVNLCYPRILYDLCGIVSSNAPASDQFNSSVGLIHKALQAFAAGRPRAAAGQYSPVPAVDQHFKS